MKIIQLNDGNIIPMLGLGTWNSPEGVVYKAIREAINMGYRHIDCAAFYGNEHEIGLALSDAIKNNDVKREELFITSKLWCNAHAKEDVIPALEKTLLDLHLDYLDLYLIHWPVATRKDILVPELATDFIPLEKLPISETWRPMEAAVSKKLVKSIGVSNFSSKKLTRLFEIAEIPPAMNQIEIHPFFQQNALIQFCNENNIAVTAYSPLGSSNRSEILEHPIITDIAKKHHATASQVVLGWAINRNTIVIPKSTHPERLKQNFAGKDITLDQADMEQIATMDKNQRFIKGKFFTLPNSGYTLENLWD